MNLKNLGASPLVKRVAAVMAISAAGLAAITRDEGSIKHVYLDPVGIPTVCVGHTGTVSRADVGRKFSQELCDELLRHDTADAQKAVARAIQVPLTQAQYDALVSFAFNVGTENLYRSTLRKKLNAGDCLGAAREFPRWNKANGVVLPGLTARRARERAGFETGC